MAKEKDIKTNVSRVLTAKKVAHTMHAYDTEDGAIDGLSVAKKLGQDPARVFKTLVTEGHSREHYVFVVPVEASLDLKKAASAAGEKNIAMIPQKDLLPLTGYIHGGCSPIGMKKAFKTFLDRSAEPHPTICVSAGKVGIQCELAPSDLCAVSGAKYADLVTE